MSQEPVGVALFQLFPELSGRVPWVRLGTWPTPIEPFGTLAQAVGGELWIKRDDLSAPKLGGNKVRTLEALMAQAQARGARRIWATGPYGSNHALATVVFAAAVDLDLGLGAGVMLFPQPHSLCAHKTLELTLSARPAAIRTLWSWASLPHAITLERLRRKSYVMPPGGATREGALAYVSAALELLLQVRAGVMPMPDRVVVPAGSTCTAAGLVAGLAAAEKLGLAPPKRPVVWAVRVSPWPVTSKTLILRLARRALALLTTHARLDLDAHGLASRLHLVDGFVGRGYGHPTSAGQAAIERFRVASGPTLDTSYSAKAAAAMFARPEPGVTLFWATKNSRPLPAPDPDAIAAAPRALRSWLRAGLLG